MQWLIDFFLPLEDDSKAQRRWRRNVGVGMLAGAILFIGAASKWGFAWASDTDNKIKQAIEPIAQQQKIQGDKLDKVSALLTEQLAATVAAQIRLTISKRCKTTGYSEREELNREKDRLQDQYYAYKGQRYAEPLCGDL